MKKSILPILLTLVSYWNLGFVLYTLYYIERNSHDKDSYIIPLLFAIATYVLTGIALTILARAVDHSPARLAWIPFARLYLLGSLADVYTANRLTTEEAVRAVGYRPSRLRHQLPLLRAGNVVAGVFSFVAFMLFLIFSLIPLLFLSAAIYYGDFDLSHADLEVAIPMLAITFGGTWLAITAVISNLAISGLFAVCHGVALSRIYSALGLPCAPLWAAVSVPNPLLTALLLLIYTLRAKDRAERFLPPREDPAQTPPESPAEIQAQDPS